jgi:DNA-binding NarL/FixJ family response regulator
MGGEQAVKKLRELDPNIKAIVSSGYADNPVVSDYQAYGFAAYLNKPYKIDSLRDCLNALLG